MSELDTIAAILPSTYYADRPVAERVKFIVREWQRLIPIVNKLEDIIDEARGYTVCPNIDDETEKRCGTCESCRLIEILGKKYS